MAQMTYGHYREVINQFPKFQKYLIAQTYTYDDPNRKFIKKTFKSIEFMKECLSLQSLNHLFYTLKWVEYEEGEYIYKAYDLADNIVIVTNGLCEVYTYFEGNKFTIDYISVGSIINQQNFFLEDLIYINIRCLTRTHV